MGGSEAEGGPLFCLGVDLEDVRSMVPGGERYAEAVPRTTRLLLDFLARRGARTTFFTVGDVARRYPDLVAEIAEAGHELACHSSDHDPLDRLDRDGLRRDLERNREDLLRAGAREVVGFRAPIFSLTAETVWAYDVLAELGFSYSSSVLPRRSPLYGWEGFGDGPVRTGSGVWEVPISTCGLGGRGLPFAGGVYFRVLPFGLVRWLFARRRAASEVVVGYIHPYDLDTSQERFVHPGLGGNPVLNALMYVNRRRVLPRLERLADGGWRLGRYVDLVRRRERELRGGQA